MRRLDVHIPAPDGRSHGTLHVPDGDGPWPGVLMFPDAGGPREKFGQMGDRLAGMGYVTLIPDIYYRAGHWEPSALTGAGADHTLEIYPARHGFAVPYNLTYDTEADARHWAALQQLYQAHLR